MRDGIIIELYDYDSAVDADSTKTQPCSTFIEIKIARSFLFLHSYTHIYKVNLGSRYQQHIAAGTERKKEGRSRKW